jgi:hypothetical protein
VSYSLRPGVCAGIDAPVIPVSADRYHDPVIEGNPKAWMISRHIPGCNKQWFRDNNYASEWLDEQFYGLRTYYGTVEAVARGITRAYDTP